ncbi:Hypothetical protein MexAM1_META2p1149 (plasmid) [Methylorubrum extorquens AM1]|uniref:Uncharacterized protein n=1 Tax=Methylorubrum extorquens (strain ATCC 14718 / DSM 1338 / JCM 2805 / NCIMB 9133 / AM1) TaxID=272630 RepID=C5B637_METEA|nr:Hypothetical protein MexAM1_META2p1149 [Methylorubrum extorquens AM1]
MRGTASERDTRPMSCRHQLDTPPECPPEGAPSGCRKWRRWPRELPRPANDNGGGAITWVLLAAGGALVGTLSVIALLTVLVP